LELRYLLDTHVILWLLDEYSNLSESTRKIIEDSKISCFVSKVSFFEIAIKKNISKLNISYSVKGLELELRKQNIEILGLEASYLDYYVSLPAIENHKDPFDRLLISTAAVENLTILSIDEKFKNYHNIVSTIW
jgi:PIN domain nuclease of toxin-antitoxin system